VPDQRSSRALPALPADADVEAQVLGKLVERAEETHSDALIVWKDGRTIVDTTFGGPRRPIEAMSVTKSVASLAIAHLSGAGKLGLDTPVHTLYPEWDQGRKKSITVRHLLNHTSGLQADVHTREIYASPDFVKLALAAELVSDPGERFFYNNKAVNLLAGVVQRASGQPLDAYLAQHVFAPLGITDVTWTRDAAGNPHAMAGIQIHARDLLKLGQLMLDRGAWEGKQIIPATWVDEATSSGQEHQRACGLLWWLTPEWSKALIDDEVIAGWRETGMDEAFIRKILPLKDRLFAPGDYFAEIAKVLGGPVGLEEWYDMTWRAGRSDGKTVDGPVSGFSAKGYLGQFVVVRTRERIIAVRQIDAASHRGEEDGFNDFAALVQSL
jgi:CubicO group peptidase (beta-lactamase class C family)